MKTRLLGAVSAALATVVSISSQAVTLQNGDVLHFTTGAGSSISGHGATGTAFDSATLDSLNGIVIGTAQPTYPDIDQTWTTMGFLITGNHYTSSSVDVLSDTTLDFSGWVMNIGGFEDYAFGQTQGIATYSYDGTNFTLDYLWDATSDNGGTALGGLAVTDYHLHLVGTVVPVPAAVWLFGSGLLGLIGVAKKKEVA